MKKLKALLLAIPLLFLTACTEGNRVGGGHTNHTWTHAHISINDRVIHDEVIEYYFYGSDSVTVELNLKSYGWVKVGFNNCMLYTVDRCPLCNK